MTRVTNGVATRKRRKRILKQTRGYFGNKSRLFRYANDAYWRAGAYAFRDRRKKKGEFRRLWIVRINAACRAAGISYSRFINGLKKCNIELDRKQLSELAIRNEEGFKALIAQVLKACGADSKADGSASAKPAAKRAVKKAEKLGAEAGDTSA